MPLVDAVRSGRVAAVVLSWRHSDQQMAEHQTERVAYPLISYLPSLHRVKMGSHAAIGWHPLQSTDALYSVPLSNLGGGL
jgi:hypothetical protein